MKYPLVEISLHDMCTTDHWLPIAELENESPVFAQAVGWLVDEDDERIILSGLITEYDKCSSRIEIPTGMIKTRKVIKEGEDVKRTRTP